MRKINDEKWFGFKKNLARERAQKAISELEESER